MFCYRKLFDIMLERGQSPRELLQIMSYRTYKKLYSGGSLSGVTISKICDFLELDSMEWMEWKDEKECFGWIS